MWDILPRDYLVRNKNGIIPEKLKNPGEGRRRVRKNFEKKKVLLGEMSIAPCKA